MTDIVSIAHGAEDFDTRLRREAMQFLTVRTNDGLNSISKQELLDFTIDGEMFRLMDPQRGIRKPRQLSSALSISTVYRREGADRPYEDAVGADGFLRYKWSGVDPDHQDNRGLRAAMEQKVPLIWFFGVGPGQFQPVFPVYLVDEEVGLHQFVVATEFARDLHVTDSPIESHLRRYLIAETKRRLHQPVFRATVMRAYETRCAVCSLGHSSLLDAAHIVPDSDEAGVASVRNGLAMCKIHHAAFDVHILGISPDLVVEIRQDLLEEIDGPMLEHGLKERHGQKLMVIPALRSERPDPELLALSYKKFQSAG
ncbi:HNH endonuclease [Rhodococcus globerulus]|uniref:HNH endonuclease signature motif containing protein n=1 Tax=Rhodococcus globerulus TaxID=33008 RepID=A0ABU4C0E2_RHOGO|nr:HNH endonuclease signature motif containing protein [Rhodococcus globerulus]MDV6269838.1 HNH endonuclease signature motif containing protein [Rhodococcus globerulus]